MLKLSEIPIASGNSPDWDKDMLIEGLEKDGHKTISVDRAVLTIEQCENTDSFPEGMCDEPLCITIYPDPDAGFDPTPEKIYIHAIRSGTMEVFLVRNEIGESKISRLLPVDARSVKNLEAKTFSSAAKASCILQIVRENFGKGPSTLPSEQSKELEQLGKEATEAVKKYVAKLELLSSND